MLRSPCIGCDLELEDKGGGRCMQCDARLRYVGMLSGDGTGLKIVVEEKADARERRTEDRKDVLRCGAEIAEVKTNMEVQRMEKQKEFGKEFMKRCRKCEKEKLASTDSEKSEFYTHKGLPDGFENRCKVCRAKMEKDRRAKRPAENEASKKPVKQEEPAGKAATSPAVTEKSIQAMPDEPKTLTVDFTDYPDLLDKIKDFASADFRTPEAEILCMISMLPLLNLAGPAMKGGCAC